MFPALTLHDIAPTVQGQSHKGNAMPKIELRLSDGEKAKLQAAADARQLRLATWCKAHLLLAAAKPVGGSE